MSRSYELEHSEFLRAIERLESFQSAKPSRRFLVAIDNAIAHMEKFLLRVLEERCARPSDASLAHWASEATVLIEALKKERTRIASLVRQELN